MQKNFTGWQRREWKMQNEKKYKVDNAVIMAAGMSTRLAPLSYETPKALLNVHGEILIERQIRQLREAGIEEIFVVTGYKKECFSYLEEKMGVKLIENPYYESRNNHSSLYVVREYLKNTYICCGDNYFTENVFQAEEKDSYYATVFEEGETDEWCVFSDENGRIREVEIGGQDQWVMKGHAFLSEEFTTQLKPYLEEAMEEKSSANLFWEDLFIAHRKEMTLYQKKIDHQIICEFDSLEELRQFDSYYQNQTGSKIMENLADMLHCEEREIQNIYPLKQEGTAVGIRFLCRGVSYRYKYGEKEIGRYEK